jgi:pyrroline-5-carboxylate reductase
MQYELAIVGAGVMAEAIARGILTGKVLRPAQIIAADISPQRRELFQSLAISVTEDSATAAAGAATVLLCVKPFQMESVLAELAPKLRGDALVISIAAGISTGFIEKSLGAGASSPRRVIRSMPNTPMLVGEGMVAIAPGQYATADDLARAARLFGSSAKVLQTTEDKIDAVTAVSGSGPAYFFFLVEQMIRAGVEMGLTEQEASMLAIQTASGAARMMSQSSDAPAEHRKRVTTPNGTTHAAISYLESHNWPAITTEALKAAARRSRELGK